MWSTLEKIPWAAEKNSVAVRQNVLFISIKQFDLCYSLTLRFLSWFSVCIPDLEISMRYQNHPLLLYQVPCDLLCPLVFILWSWEPQYSTHICLGLLYILCILFYVFFMNIYSHLLHFFCLVWWKSTLPIIGTECQLVLFPLTSSAQNANLFPASICLKDWLPFIGSQSVGAFASEACFLETTSNCIYFY